MNDTVTPVEKHGTEDFEDQAVLSKLLLSGDSERFEVQWDGEAKVTPMGSLVFFAQYVQAGGLLDRLCEGTPLAYTSNNAPKERDVLGTVVLSILNSTVRRATHTSMRYEAIVWVRRCWVSRRWFPKIVYVAR